MSGGTVSGMNFGSRSARAGKALHAAIIPGETIAVSAIGHR